MWWSTEHDTQNENENERHAFARFYYNLNANFMYERKWAKWGSKTNAHATKAY